MAASTDIGIKLSLDGAAQVQAGLQSIGAAMDKVGMGAESIKSAVGGVSGMLTSLVGVATVGGFAALVKGSIDSAAALNDLAIQSGASVEALSGLASVGKLSGQSADSIASAMNKLARNMAGATEESKGTGKALEAIGINFATFSRLAPDEQMRTVATAMGNFADGSSKAAVAMALFGKEGAQMLPFLKDLGAMGEISAKVTTAQAAAADNLGDTLTKLKGSTSAWVKEIAMGMVPALDQAATSFFEVMTGTNGLRDEARRLSADGSIEQWTRNAITGITYLMDTFSVLKNVVKTVGQTLGAVVAAGVETFSGIGAAVARVLRGDFKGAYDEMSAANTRANAVWTSLKETVQDTWGEQTLGSKIRARMADLQAAGTVAEGVKKRLEFVNSDAAKGPAKEDPQAKAYAGLIASIQEKIAAQQLELQSGEKLTEAEKARLEIQKMVAKGAITVADAESQQTKALLDRLDATEQAKRAEEAYQKRVEELAKARASELTAQLQSTKATQDQLATQLQANEAIGLTKEAVANLEATRLEAQATQKRELATTIELTEGNILLADAYRQQADALEGLAKAKRTGAARQAAFDEAKKAEDEWKRAADKIENSLTDALMRGFEGGKGFAKNLRDTVANMFKTLVLRPIISAVVNPVAGALTGALGLAGTANAGQGGGLGAGDAFGLINSLGTGLGGGFGMIAGGGIGGWLSASTSLIGTGTAAGAMAGLGALAGPIGAVMAVASLVKALDDSGTMHTGGIGGYSAAGGSLTGAAAGLRFGIDAKDYNASTEQASAAISKSIVGILDSTAATFGKEAGFYAATAFADDSSRDGAWGALMVKLGDKVLLDWANNPAANGDANVPRVFANGEEGLKQYTAEIGKSVRDVVLSITPAWADKFFTSLGENPTLEQVAQAYQQLEQFSMAVVGVSDDTLNGLFKSLIAGEKTAAETGTALADAIVGGVKNSVASAGAQAMTDVAKQYLIMPLVNAIMSGGDLNAALNSIDFDRVGKVMGLLSSGTQELLAKGDWEGFKKAIQGTVTATDAQTKATNDQKDSTLKLSNVLDGTLSATVKAANGLDAVNTALKNLGLSGTVAASAVGAPSASIPGFAVGTNYVPNDMLAMIHQGERIIPAADNRALMAAVGRNASSAGVITSAFAGVGGSLVTKLDEILQALKGQGVNTGGSSYIQGLQTAKTDFDNTMAAMVEWFGNQGSVVSGQFTDWRFQHGYTGATAPQEALVEFLRNFYPQTAAEFINAAQTYEDAVAKLSAEMEKQAADMLAPLIEQMTGASDPFAVLSKQAQEYIDKLDALGQATAANVGTVEQWLAAMQESTRSDLYSQLLSEEERNALALENLTGKFTALGVAIPASAEGFRTLLDGIDTTTAAGRALYDALVQLVPGFLDLASVANAVNPAAEALTTAQKATDAAMEALRASVAAEQAQINNLLDSARKQSSTIRSVFETLSSAVDDLYGTAAGGMTAASGRALIDQALASGQLPENGELQNAITAIKSSFESAQYASEFEQRKAQLTFAGNLSKLKDAAGEQLSAAEQQVDLLEAQLKALDNQLAAAQEQINALRGIDGGVKTVAEALAALTAALNAESAAKAAIENQAKADKAFVQKLYQDVLHRDADAGGMAYWLGKLGAGIKPTDLIAMFIQASQAELALPQFASGGDHKGGLRIVGENGPELEATGASRIYSNTQLRDIFAGGQKRDESLVAEIRSLREDNQAQARAMVQMQARMAKLMERWDGNGMPETRVV